MPAKITFDLKKQQIIVEGDEADLLKIAQEAKSLVPQFSEIRILTDSNATKHDEESQNIHSTVGSLRQFAKSLPLTNTYERIAAIAYYIIKIEKKLSFSAKEMSDWFGLCGFQKPGMMATALADARRKYGYIDNKGRDQWTITTSGENLIIEHMEK